MVQTYTLYLSTLITAPTSNLVVPLNITDIGNAVWQVDFRSLFNGDNKKYKRCSVRFNLQSSTWTAAAADWANYCGYLSINLPSNYISTTGKGSILGLIYPQDCPTTSSTVHCYQVNTMGHQQGVDINMPGDNQLLNIQFLNDDSFNTIGTLPDYQLLLQFELSEPIE